MLNLNCFLWTRFYHISLFFIEGDDNRMFVVSCFYSNFKVSMPNRWIIGLDCLARGSSHGFAGNSRNVQGEPLRAEAVQEKEQFP